MRFDRSTNERVSKRGMRAPPHYLGRYMQYRLMALLGALFLVFFLMREARDPNNYRALFSPKREPPVDTRVPRGEAPRRDDGFPRVEQLVGGTAVVGGTAAPPASDGVANDGVANDGVAKNGLSDEEGPPAPDVAPSRQGDGAFSPTPAAAPPGDEVFRRGWSDAWAKLAEQFTLGERALLNQALRSTRRGQPMPPEDREAWRAALDRWNTLYQRFDDDAQRSVMLDGELSERRKGAWLAVLERMRAHWTALGAALRKTADDAPLAPDARRLVDDFRAFAEQAALEAIEDDSMYRGQERDALSLLLADLRDSSAADLAARSTGVVNHLGLYAQPTVHRGKLVTLRGVVKRARRMRGPANHLELKWLYACWIHPAGEDSPVVAWALELPPGFPATTTSLGDAESQVGAGEAKERPIKEPVEVTGYFFKKWVYGAEDGARSAPLLLVKSLDWKPAPPPAPRQGPTGWDLALIAAGACALGVVIAALAYWRTRQRTPAELYYQSLGGAHLKRIDPRDVKPSVAESLKSLQSKQ